jgi:hypothetical protein
MGGFFTRKVDGGMWQKITIFGQCEFRICRSTFWPLEPSTQAYSTAERLARPGRVGHPGETQADFSQLNIIYHQNILIIGTIVYAGYPEAKKSSTVDEEFENF